MSKLIASFTLLISAVAMANEDPSKMLVFVGELIDIEELPDQCPKREAPYDSRPSDENDSTEQAIDFESICIQFDALFRATYRVLDILYGNAEAEVVTFKIADHYGFPDFAYFKNALLFVKQTADAQWLEKYQGYAVHRTKEDSWATCGNPYDERMGDEPRYLVEPRFRNELGSVGEFSEVGIRRIFGDSLHIVLDGNSVHCRAGVNLEEFYDIVRTGVLAARSINLPKLSTPENEL